MRLQPITVHVPRDLKRWMEKEAERVDLSFAAYVRRILKLYRQQEEEASHEQREPEPTAEPPAGEPGTVQAK